LYLQALFHAIHHDNVLSDIADMLSLALELAVEAECFSPIAILVTDNIQVATFMTRVVVPVLYVPSNRQLQGLTM